MKHLQVMLGTFMTAAALSVSAVELAPVFSDNMILQRETKVPVWGTGTPGENVSIAFAEQKKHTTVSKDGTWRINLDPMPSSAENRVLVVQGENQIKLHDVLVGDIWIAVGQSNMEFPLRSADHAATLLEQADDPQLRILKVPYAWSVTPQTQFKSAEKWKKSDPKSARRMTAVGYSCAFKLRRQLGIPIGLIDMSKSGSRIEAWSDPTLYRNYPSLRKDAPAVEKMLTEMQKKVPDRRDKYRLPKVLYNAMTKPAAPFAIRGILYYQGEDNRREAEQFPDKMAAFLASWRTLFENEKLPIYLVMIPNFNYPQLPEPRFVEFRRAQQRFAEKEPLAGYIVITDLGDDNDAHPRNKIPVGERLADLVLYKEYGKLDPSALSPVFDRVAVQGNKAILHFRFANGLTTRDGQMPRFFELAGPDRHFVPAQATIVGETIELTSPDVANPTAVRFSWHMLDNSNLVNRRNHPVTPFSEEIYYPIKDFFQGFKLKTSENAEQAILKSEPFKVDSKQGFVKVSGKLNVPQIAPRSGNDFGVLLEARFYDAKGRAVGSRRLVEFRRPSNGTELFQVDLNIPSAAEKIQFEAKIRNAVTDVYFSDMKWEVLAPRNAAVDAEFPADRAQTWGKEPLIRTGSHRAEMILNGLWRFQPINLDKNLTSPMPKGWGWINVPGSWRAVRGLDGVAAVGGGELWNSPTRVTRDKMFSDLNAGWYQRDFSIPAEWKGRTIELELTRVASAGRILIDGRYAGKIQHPEGKIDLTRFVTPGKTHKLAIQVFAIENTDQLADSALPPNRSLLSGKDNLKARGLSGDVVLSCRSAGPELSGVQIQTSFRKKNLRLNIELTKLRQGGKVLVAPVARLRGKTAEPPKVFQPLEADVRPDSAGAATLTLEWPWENPALWNTDTPNLYDLELTVKGNGINEMIRERFGFREFWISGRNFFLNGEKINLRPAGQNEFAFPVPTIEVFKNTVASWRYSGHNISQIWPERDFPGRVYFPEKPCLEYCAETGWPVIANLEDMRRYVLKFQKDAPGRVFWEQQVTRQIRRNRNNPAIVMWIHAGNTFSAITDQDPHYLGNKKALLNSGALIGRAETGLYTIDFIKKLDPTRPALVHAGCVGDVFTANAYPSVLPLQEQEEWLSLHVKQGDVPLMLVEYGFIPAFDFRRGRFGYQYVRDTEFQMTERLAGRYGNKAYQMESYRAAIWNRDHHLRDEKYRGNDRYIADTLAQQWFAEDIRRVYRSWRVAGHTGGMILWMINDIFDRGRVSDAARFRNAVMEQQPSFQPGRRGPWLAEMAKADSQGILPSVAEVTPPGQAYLDSNSATLAYLAGKSSPDDPDSFLGKEHNFYGKTLLEKQLALLNDTTQTALYHYHCILKIAGKKVEERKGDGTLPASEKVLLPFQFNLPEVTEKTDAELLLSATIAGKKHQDRFALRIFPARKPHSQRLTIIDPEGVTSAHLARLGYQVQNLKGSPQPGSLLLIGRKALDLQPDLLKRLNPFVCAGGKLLIFSQSRPSPDFRAGSFANRQIFPVAPNHPVFAGLDAEDLRDWNGAGTQQQAYPRARKSHEMPQGFRWGNRGTVASIPFEKSHYGAWTPLAECDFDLAYTPLAEVARGKGGAIFSQCDFERGTEAEPAAEKMLDNLIAYAQSKQFFPRAQKTVFIGNEIWQKKLKQTGLHFTSSQSLVPDADLTIVAPGAQVDIAQLRKFAESGKQILICGNAFKQFALKTRRVSQYRGSQNPPDWHFADGLSASDLRWRSPLDADLFDPANSDTMEVGADGQLARIRCGQGELLFSLLDPDRFDCKRYPYFRFTRWRQSRALSQLLTNLGGSFSADDALFNGPRTGKQTHIDLTRGWRCKLVTPCGIQPTPMAHFPMTEAAQAAMKVDFDDSLWQLHDMPFTWQTDARDDSTWSDDNGEAVFRKEVIVPPEFAGRELTVSLGVIDDFDAAFFNGECIGRCFKYNEERLYKIPGRLVKAGRNLLAVRVFDCWGSGGMLGPAKKMRIQLYPEPEPEKFYHTDYRNDNFALSDDPFRYFRW